MKTLKKYVLQCFLTDNKQQVKLWCPYCNEYHIHGVDRNLLDGNSPFKHDGYYLEMIPAF
jgi:hypothetical protein